MHFPNVKRAFSGLFFLSAILITVNAHALHIGEANVYSRIGEPLNATVGLWLNSKEKAGPISFKLTPDLQYRNNTALTRIVNQLDAHLQYSENGTPYVHIISDTIIAEPVVTFRLKVYAGDKAVMRNISFTLSPKTTSSRDVTQTSVSRPTTFEKAARVETPRLETPNAKSRPMISGSDYTVARGDTLWGIARRVASHNTANVGELVNEIFNANPHAFVNGDQNRLKLGAALSMPGTTSAATTSETATTIRTPVAEAAVAETTPVQTPATTTAVTSNRDDATATQSTNEAKRVALTWQERKPELAAELERLRVKYAALKARYDETAAITDPVVASPASESSVPVVVEAPATVDTVTLQGASDSPTVTVTTPVNTSKETELPATSAPSAESVDQSATRGEATMAGASSVFQSILSSTTSLLILGTLGALFALTLIGWLTTKLYKSMKSHRAQAHFNEMEESRKAEVARKAQSRIEMEGEVQRMFDERNGEAATAEAVPSTTEEAPTILTSSVTPENEDAEIDLNIAHGRYAEAEKLLAQVIEKTPRNYSAKLRLIEVFYMTERVEEFCALAQDLHQNHRSDMADEEWRRVVRMGKIVAPEQPPFSGPRAVQTNPTEAS